MDPALAAVARQCLAATHDGSLDFPAIVARLIKAGFEAYAVDYRRGAQTFYLPDGACLDLPLPDHGAAVAESFDAARIKNQIRWAQSGDRAYTYAQFSRHVAQAGCAGYLVSFPGRRVVYYGRTGETLVEEFPQ